MQLFSVTSTGRFFTSVKSTEPEKEIAIRWFVTERKKQLDFSDYLSICKIGECETPGTCSDTRQAYMCELFTWEEAEELKKYLKENLATESLIEEACCASDEHCVPLSAIHEEPAAGEGYGFIDLTTIDGYKLPFSVKGFFDTEYEDPQARYQLQVVINLLQKPADVVCEEDQPAGDDLHQLARKLQDLSSAIKHLQGKLITFLGTLPEEDRNK